jgi:5-methylthioribose kinase
VAFELTVASVPAYLVRLGLAPPGATIVAEELQGGVSASVVAVRVPATGLEVVVKQALPRLRVADEWRATQARAETEVAALRLCAELTPGAVPRVLASDPGEHVLVMELVAATARNWQAEIAEGRVHPACGRWAGETIGAWHVGTASRADVEAAFDDFEAFEQLRLHPFHETVMERRPELAEAIAPYLAELRAHRCCLVHGDYAKKNMLVGPTGCWVLDFEVAHYGNPVFDLGFFLSFVVLSAVRWPELATELRALGDSFLAGYAETAGAALAPADATLVGHTACLVLARPDGKSPAQFLEPRSRELARAAGIALLHTPERGLWGWT